MGESKLHIIVYPKFTKTEPKLNMFFYKQGQRYFVSYTTGPSDVMVGLSFDDFVSFPKVVRLVPINHHEHAGLEEYEIRESVLEGIAEACVQQGASLNVREIIYNENSTPNYQLFKHCGALIVRQILAGNEFREIPEDTKPLW